MIVSSGWDLQLGHSRCISGGRRFGSEERIAVLKSSSRRNPRSAGWSGDSHSWENLWFERCALTLVEKWMSSISFTRRTFDVCVYSPRSTAGSLEGILVCSRGRHNLFSKALLNLRHRFPFRKWQVGEGMFCGSKYVQNKATKDIMITQTEFAAIIVKIRMSAARKKMREDLADKAEIHAFRGVSQLAGWSDSS